jgi:hypothetical protein
MKPQKYSDLNTLGTGCVEMSLMDARLKIRVVS